MRAPLATALVLLSVLAVPASAGGGKTYAIPGDAVYPEGVAYDQRNRQFYVGSTTDGTIFRGTLDGDAAQSFLPGGADGRSTAIGMKVSSGLLFVAGGATGDVWVYDIATQQLAARFRTGRGGFLNDLVIERDGDVIVTDSQRLFLLKISAAQVRAGRGAPRRLRYPRGALGGFNANGIVVSAEDEVVFVDSGDGTLTRMNTDSGQTRRLRKTGSGALTNGDGLVLSGRTLYVVRNQQGRIAVVRLDRRARTARVLRQARDATFRYPTTAALAGSRLLVVNSQFDKRGSGDAPEPFTLSSVARP